MIKTKVHLRKILKHRKNAKLVEYMNKNYRKREFKSDVLNTSDIESDIIQLMYDVYPLDQVTWLDSIYRAEEYSRSLNSNHFLSEYNISNLCKKGLIGFSKDPNSSEKITKGKVAKEHIRFWTSILQGYQSLIDTGVAEKITANTVKINLQNTSGGRVAQENKLQSVAITIKSILTGFNDEERNKILEIFVKNISES